VSAALSVVLVGPNGAGKTTLLKALSGPPHTGEALGAQYRREGPGVDGRRSLDDLPGRLQNSESRLEPCSKPERPSHLLSNKGETGKCLHSTKGSVDS
jgi:energy-coupling factor transporter ATP-binding protein EcfA2